MDDYIKSMIDRMFVMQEELTEKRVQIRMLTQLLWDEEKNDKPGEKSIVYTSQVREIFGIMPYPREKKEDDHE